MKKIITAINNPILNQRLTNEKNIEVIGKDIQYKEAILEILEKEEKIDLLIISENLPGEIDIIQLVKKVKKYGIKIIFILEKQNELLEENLKKENVDSIYYNNKITIDKIIEIVKNDDIKDEEDIKKEIEILKEIVLKNEKKNNKNQVYITINKVIKNILKKFKKNNKKADKKQQKIITFCGNNCVGKSSIIATFSKINIENINKILIINFDKKNKDIFYMISKEKISKTNLKMDKNLLQKINNKISILDGENLIYNDDFDEEKFKKVIKGYDVIYIDNSLLNKEKIEEKLLKISDKIICLSETNIINISKTKKLLEKYINKYSINEKKINILFNKYNKYSISEEILKKIFFDFIIIGKIKSNIKYNFLINTNYKKISKKIKKESKKILLKIILN